MTTDEKLDRIIEMLEVLILSMPDDPVPFCDHTANDSVSPDGKVHCVKCDKVLF